ncbi:MAG: serine hydrolase [Acidobacteria bacterium]|nr:serine hydrolase [Acidobacteriota bacterium]
MLPPSFRCSTAGDLLTYLEAQLQGSSAAIRLSHELRGDLVPGIRIALAWAYNEDTGTYWHNGAISAYTSHALFNPREGYAVVVLVNQAISLVAFADLVAQHIQERLRGEPAISLASVIVPASGGISGVARVFAAYWLTMLLAGMFVYCSVLVLQGLAVQLLPRRIFLRVSSYLQLTAFCVILCVYVLQPLVAGARSLIAANGNGLLAWSPSYWFLGLFQQLNGSPALPLLARRAWMALAIAVGCTAIVYTLSYLRTLRRIAEEPDIVPGARGGVWLPRFGSALETVIVQFSIRTLLRSRWHRLILAFYLGVGFAFMILLVKAPAVRQQLEDAPVSDPWGQVNAPLLAATIAMMGFATLGTRVIFSMPLDLRANWIFQITGVRRAAECLEASRRSLLVLSFVPVWLASAAACLWLWPWLPAAGHLAILAGLGLILAEICLHGFQKIPFTCSYLPGKSQVHLSVLGGLGLLGYLGLSVRYELRVLEDFGGTIAVVVVLALIAACARWRTQAAARSEQEEIQFEEAPEPAVQTLRLNRDGSWEVGAPNP